MSNPDEICQWLDSPPVNNRGHSIRLVSFALALAALTFGCTGLRGAEVRTTNTAFQLMSSTNEFPWPTSQATADWIGRSWGQSRTNLVRQSLEAAFLDQSRGDYPGAITQFTFALALDPTNYHAHLGRGLAYQHTHELTNSIADLNEAIRLRPNSAKAFDARGLCWFFADNPTNALKDYSKALALDPNLASAYAGRGALWLKQSNFALAIKDFDQALKIAPTDLTTAYCRGQAQLITGDWRGAIEDFTRVIEANPRDSRAYFGRASAFYKLNKWEHAISDYSECLALDPTNAPALHDRALAYKKTGTWDKAIADYDAAIGLRRGDWQLYFGRADAFSHKGQWTNALADLREAVKVDPGRYVPRNDLAWLLATCPDPSIRDGKSAVTEATKACDLAEWKKPNCLDTLAAAYAESGNFEQAVKYEKQAVSMSDFPEKERANAEKRLELYRQGKPYRQE